MSARTTVKTVTIPSGQALSSVLDVSTYNQVGIIMPSAWTAANLTFQASDTPNGTFVNVHDEAGTEVTVTAAASRAIGIKTGVASEAILFFRYLKVRSGTNAVPVNQAAERVLILVLKQSD